MSEHTLEEKQATLYLMSKISTVADALQKCMTLGGGTSPATRACEKKLVELIEKVEA